MAKGLLFVKKKALLFILNLDLRKIDTMWYLLH